MAAGLQVLYRFATCAGHAVVVGGEPAGDDVELALASCLGEVEADGEVASAVVLRLGRRQDSAWAEAAVPWLAAHGRRVLVRTRAVLSRRLVRLAADHQATVSLELAHVMPPIQHALLGPHAASPASLLLQAQHLSAEGVEVVAHLGPLLPTLHDDPVTARAIVRNVTAADIRDAHLGIGRLTPARLEALDRVLPRGITAAVAHAYGVRRGSSVWSGSWSGSTGSSSGGGGARLAPMAAAALHHSVRRVAEEAGLRIDACGCPAQCHLDAGSDRPAPPSLTPSLFGLAG